MTSPEKVGLSPAEAGQVFVTPAAYADETWFHAACEVLRREEPIHHVLNPDYPPFWVLTRHADISYVEAHGEEFINGVSPVLMNYEAERRQQEQGLFMRTLIHMDGDEHRAHRNVTAKWFHQQSLAQIEDRVDRLARDVVDRMATFNGQCDLVEEMALRYPLQVILSILGLPDEDYPRMLMLTQEFLGRDDPELARGETLEDLLAVITDFFLYFNALTEDRRSAPTDDLASVIANATIGSEPLGPIETASYYITIVAAGHDTTASAISGGMRALIEHPEQLARLQCAPQLIPTAVEEMIRWVTPVKHFMRSTTTAHQVGDHLFEPGDALLLSYPSANRDEAQFSDPWAFDVGRSPNKHLGFGFAAHYCLGAMLARMEMKALLAELLPRLRSIELAGEPELAHTLFVGGLKRLPVRYELAD